jgi:NAD(P)-dependent dehydrogenase (short-subunit alcohol dehydrogenase family)
MGAAHVAWVTGGGRGIGRAAAFALAGRGLAVAVSSRTRSEINQVAEAIRANGGRSLAAVVDVSARGTVEAAARDIESALGPIDVLVNNAGVLAPLGKLWETDPEQWKRLIDINLGGPYYCMRAVLPGMIRRGRGVVVNVSSGAAVSTSPGWSAYAASKAGLDHLTRCLAVELASGPIRVFGLHPGLTDTAMLDVVRAATEREMPAERRQFFADQRTTGNIFPPRDPRSGDRVALFSAV